MTVSRSERTAGLLLVALAVALAPACDRPNLRPIASDSTDTSDGTDATDLTDDTDVEPMCGAFERGPEDVDTVECRVPFGSYTFTETWRHPVLNRYLPPLLAHLDDDNGDGLIGEGDVPEILFQKQIYRELPDHGVYVVDSVTGEQRDFWPGTHPTAWVDMGFGPGLFGRAAGGRLLPDATDPSEFFTLPDEVDGEGRCDGFTLLTFGDVDGDGVVDLLRPHGWYSPSQEMGSQRSGDGWSSDPHARGHYCVSTPIMIEGGRGRHFVSSRHIYDEHGRIHCEVDGVDDGVAVPADYDGDDDAEVMLISSDSISLYDHECNVLAKTDDGMVARIDHTRVAPLLDEQGADLLVIATLYDGVGGSRGGYFILDAQLNMTQFQPPEQYEGYPPEVVDLDGDGLYEVFAGRDLWNPRTGEIIASLPLPRDEVVLVQPWVADVDGDRQAEVLAVVCPLGYCYNGPEYEDGYLTVFEGDGFAPAPTTRRNDVIVRGGEMLPNGRFVPADEYPPYSAHNTVNVPSFSPQWHGYGATLQAHFDRVCTDECDRRRLVVSVSVSNTGTVDVVRPVELVLTGEIEGVPIELQRWSLPDGLAAGRQTEAWTLELERARSEATDLTLSIETPGWQAETCTPVEEASVTWSEGLCE